MSYYQFNRQEILQKAKDRYSKEKAAEYYLKNKDAIKEVKEVKEEKDKIQTYQRNRYKQLNQYKNEVLQSKLIIKMSEDYKIWQYWG